MTHHRSVVSPPPGHLIKPRHNLKLIARQMEEKRPAVVVSITGWLADLITATIQFVIKIIYVMASQYRASLISQENTNINDNINRLSTYHLLLQLLHLLLIVL